MSVVYLNKSSSLYKHMQSVLGLSLNTVGGLLVGIGVFYYTDNYWIRSVALIYFVLSLLAGVFLIPKYYASYLWVSSRDNRRRPKTKRINAGYILIDGFVFEVAYGNENEIVVDCETGVAYIPDLSL